MSNLNFARLPKVETEVTNKQLQFSLQPNFKTSHLLGSRQLNLTPLDFRNAFWHSNLEIPKWVDINNVGLDQFFTRPETALACWNSFQRYMKTSGLRSENYHFIEPSAGTGSFFNLLPEERRLGIDVELFDPEYIRSDFLAWQPNNTAFNYVSIGNPPFGYRAWLALAFLNHASTFSDVVGFILPMSFQSRGKSNVQDRVKGLQLVHSELLPFDSFIDRQGKSAKVNALWQIWAKNSKKNSCKIQKTCDGYIDLFTVDLRKERLCGQKRLHEATVFLQRTFYNTPPSLVETFQEVKYVCGYGLVIKKNKEKVLELLNNADWRKHSNLASHNCRHISMCHIREVLFEGGLIDV